MENHSKVLSAKLETVVPPLDELAEVVSKFMKTNFAEVNVDVGTCPDFTKPPFSMTGAKIGSLLRIAEVGGNSNLFPVPRKNIYYNLKDIAATCELNNAFIFGPGGGPRHVIGTNCEMVADAHFAGEGDKVAVKMGVVNEQADKGHEMIMTEKPEFCLMANLGVCDGNTSTNVLRIRARGRTGKLNFPECVRQAIADHYKESLVSCAGIFLVKNGKIKIHVMPDFPNEPFASNDEVTRWLRFFEIEAPIVCVSVIHSKDVGDHKLRLEHTHCYNGHKAGHYHYDTTPDDVEYEGYFAVSSAVYRIDAA